MINMNMTNVRFCVMLMHYEDASKGWTVVTAAEVPRRHPEVSLLTLDVRGVAQISGWQCPIRGRCVRTGCACTCLCLLCQWAPNLRRLAGLQIRGLGVVFGLHSKSFLVCDIRGIKWAGVKQTFSPQTKRVVEIRTFNRCYRQTYLLGVILLCSWEFLTKSCSPLPEFQ